VRLSEAYEHVTIADNQGVVDASDVIFLGLMAEVASEVLAELKFRDGQRMITFMAGATLEQVDALVRPARAVANYDAVSWNRAWRDAGDDAGRCRIGA